MVAEQTGFSLTSWRTPKTGFSRDGAQLLFYLLGPFENQKPLTAALANIEATDAVFHPDLHCFLRHNRTSEKEIHYVEEITPYKPSMSRNMRFPTMWYVRPAVSDQPAHTRSLIRAFACRLNILSYLGY